MKINTRSLRKLFPATYEAISSSVAKARRGESVISAAEDVAQIKDTQSMMRGLKEFRPKEYQSFKDAIQSGKHELATKRLEGVLPSTPYLHSEPSAATFWAARLNERNLLPGAAVATSPYWTERLFGQSQAPTDVRRDKPKRKGR